LEANSQDGKTAALVSHFTLVGCLIAITMNLEPKNAYARFYIRQSFGFHILFHAIILFLNYTPIPYAWEVIFLLFVALWIYTFSGVVTNSKKQIPLVGPLFQKWFTFIQ